MKSYLVIGMLAALGQPLAGQSISGTWRVDYDSLPRDILSGDTVAVAKPARHGVLEIEQRGDSLVARWNPSGTAASAPRQLRGMWRNGSLHLITVTGVEVHPVVNGKETTVEVFTEWNAQLVVGALRGTMEGASKDGMIRIGTRAFAAKRAN
jgi:hypothetical protein